VNSSFLVVQIAPITDRDVKSIEDIEDGTNEPGYAGVCRSD
jgi:hypothetical protein